MGVSLNKGGNVSLSKEAPGLSRILIGLGWDTRSTDGADYDLDASLFMLNAEGRVRSDSDFIFYNNLKSTDGSVVAVTIHDAQARGQNFGQVENAFMRIVNDENAVEIARYDLSEDASTETAMIFGEVYRHGDEWKFRAVGQGYTGGLGPLAQSYGINVG
jgi:tellurium resistance protein TerD